MKTRIFGLLTVVIALMTSCTPSSYYQVYTAVPIHDIVQRDGLLVYEDENCRVSYNFWSDKGNIGFHFYNKTEKDIYLNLGESFFILNGIANIYYKNRVFTKTGSASALIASYYLGIGVTSSSNISVAQKEEDIVIIPPWTSKTISEYLINDVLYRDCELFRWPTSKEIKTATFNKENSPLVFSNRLTYMIEKTGTPVKLTNEFYVNEITNYPSAELIERKYGEFCGQRSSISTSYFKGVLPSKFYLKYTKGADYMKH